MNRHSTQKVCLLDRHILRLKCGLGFTGARAAHILTLHYADCSLVWMGCDGDTCLVASFVGKGAQGNLEPDKGLAGCGVAPRDTRVFLSGSSAPIDVPCSFWRILLDESLTDIILFKYQAQAIAPKPPRRCPLSLLPSQLPLSVYGRCPSCTWRSCITRRSSTARRCTLFG